MIEPVYFWKTVIVLGIGTICIRGSIIFLSSRIQISERVREIFSFIPSAILPAMIAPMVYFHDGHIHWLADKERFFVLILATIICYFTRSMIATICFGLGGLFLLTHIFS